MKNNYFSVIIPTYNSEKYIERTFRSLINQSYKNFEIILVDNSSYDSTLKIVNNYKKKLNLKILNVKNKGIIAISRNKGILNSSGNIISFLDSDDYWHKDKLKTINKLFIKNNIELCCHNEIHIDRNKKIYKKMNYKIYSKNLYNNLLIYGNCLSTSAVSIKTEFIKKRKLYFSENDAYKSAEDYDYWLLLAKSGARFKFIDTFLGFYQFDLNSYSNSNILIHNQRVNNVIYDHLENSDNINLINLTKSRILLSDIKILVKNFRIIGLIKTLLRLNPKNYFYIFLFLINKTIKYM